MNFFSGETIIIYMTKHNLFKIVNKLISIGFKSNNIIMLILNVTMVNQNIYLSNLCNIILNKNIIFKKKPTLLIIGDIIKFNISINWFKNCW